MTRVGAYGLLLSAVFFAGCNSSGVCTGDVCYSPLTLTCTVGQTCHAGAPSVKGPKPTAFSVWPGLPSGVTLNATTGEISGTPTEPIHTTHFVVKATTSDGPRQGVWQLLVNDVAPSALSYTPAALVCTQGTSCGATATGMGGRPASFTVSPALPAGFTLNATTGEITGLPTATSAAASFTVTATNAGGHTDATVSIEVKDAVLGALNYPLALLTCTVGQPCAVAAPKPLGSTASHFDVAPALPAGLTLDGAAGGISGTPTAVSPSAQYVVTATNGAGSTSQTLTLVVNDRAPDIRYAAPVVCKRDAACTVAAPTSTGGAVISFSIAPRLPAGLVFDTATGAVSGTPKVPQAQTKHAVTAKNSGGATTTDLVLTVNEVAPASLTYSPSTLSCTEGTPCALPAPTTTGGPILTYSATPALPDGLSVDPTTGVVGGTGIGSFSSSSFTITGSNSAGSVTATVTVSVAPIAPVSIGYSPSSVQCRKNRLCKLGPPSIVGGAPARYGNAPALPGGLSTTNRGLITGTATALSPSASYTVTGTNSLGAVTTSVTVQVVEEPPYNVTYSPASMVCTRETACTSVAPTASGDPVTSYSISPSLPSGLTINNTTGVISGTPHAGLDARPFTVYASNPGGTGTTTFNLTVVDFPPTNLVYSPSSQVCALNNPNCQFARPTNSGGVITKYTVAPALPSGLYLEPSTGRIYGTPYQATPATQYTVTGTNSGGSTSATITITVTQQPPSNLRWSPNLTCRPNQYCYALALFDGSPPTSYRVSPALPSWLSLSGGYVQGTPTSAMPPTAYTVTGTNSLGSSVTTLWVWVTQSNDLTIAGTANVKRFTGLAVHPKNANVLYAMTLTGNVYGSTNAGSTWKNLCTVPDTGGNYTNITVSPTGSAFANTYYYGYRISDLGGAPCNQLSRILYYAPEFSSAIAFTDTGRMYHWSYETGLGYSDNDGQTWTNLPSQKSLFRSVAVDPFDQSRVLSIHQKWDTSPTGVLVGTSTVINTTQTDYYNPPLFNPKYQGYIYLRASGSYSSDGGNTWQSDNNFRVLALDGNGVGYRLDYVGAPASLPTLVKAPDLHIAVPVWAPQYTFTAETNTTGDVRLSQDGKSIFVWFQTTNHLYLSTDSGVTFNLMNVTVPLNSMRPTSVAAVGSTVYLAMGGMVARSLDTGATWAPGAFVDSDLSRMIQYGRLEVGWQHPDHLYLRAGMHSGYTSYTPTLYSSSDGFQTATATTRYNGWYASEVVFGINQTDDTTAYALGSGVAVKTTNSGGTWAETTVTDAPQGWTSWYPSEGAVNPANPSQVFYTTTQYNSTISDYEHKLYRYDDTTHTNTEIVAPGGLVDPEGVAVFKSGSSYGLRLSSPDGALLESTDGVTFTRVGQPPNLQRVTYTTRLIRGSTTNPNLIASFAPGYQYLGLSFDRGTSWFEPIIDKCQNGVADVAFAGTRIIIACAYASSPAQTLTLP